jgi:quercetin 2,3-dioxygenase
MLKKINNERMGTSDLGWLQSKFHFSFARYYNPDNIKFGVLRVLNDDIIAPHSGFDMHPHENMEIITYIIEGELTHEDNLGNKEALKRGEVQYMSAGNGVVHAEHNFGKTPLRVLQIWIIPPKNGLPTLYGSKRFSKEQREDSLLHIVSSKEKNAPIQIYQDVDIYVIETQKEFSFTIEKQKQVYFVQIEGSSKVNEVEDLNASDALEVVGENALHVKPKTKSHFLFLVMNKQ